LADALTLLPGSTISGQSVPLVAVLATAPERQQQIEAVHAYWRLAEAVGEYHFSHEHQQRIARLGAKNGEAADLRTAQADAAAQLREAEVQITIAQHDLAEILRLAPDTPPPLPGDQPLIGPYRTMFAEMFRGKKAPERAHLLDQTLPLRSRAVESRAAALLAAEDALDATIELQARGQDRLASVLTALDVQVRQQRAFLAAVCRYNHDIADYALAVVSPQTTPELLAGTLIKQNRPAGQHVTPLPTMAATPATYEQPAAGPVSPTMPNRPTRAVRPGVTSGPAPRSALPARNEEPVPIESPTEAAPPNPPRSNEGEEPRLAPPQESAIPLVPEKPEGPAAPTTDAKSKDAPTARTSRKPVSGEAAPQSTTKETNPGPTMSVRWQGLTPAQRSEQLTAALYRARDLPVLAWQSAGLYASGTPAPQEPAGGTPAPLAHARKAPAPRGRTTARLIDCLRTVPASSREKTIETYWLARQAAAQYQSLLSKFSGWAPWRRRFRLRILRRPRQC